MMPSGVKYRKEDHNRLSIRSNQFSKILLINVNLLGVKYQHGSISGPPEELNVCFLGFNFKLLFSANRQYWKGRRGCPKCTSHHQHCSIVCIQDQLGVPATQMNVININDQK
ncbi:hypothetical protein J6590_052584 [Homalodisca vitripennis]|nr:hypothetical protein J6590_052584 [Homalodisca vitripennis]